MTAGFSWLGSTTWLARRRRREAWPRTTRDCRRRRISEAEADARALGGARTKKGPHAPGTRAAEKGLEPGALAAGRGDLPALRGHRAAGGPVVGAPPGRADSALARRAEADPLATVVQ